MMAPRTDHSTTALPPLSRRGFLGGVGAASLAAFTTQIGAAMPSFATSEGTVLPLVDPLPAGEPDRTLFADNEQVFAAYLMILSPLANSVIDDDPDLFGWMEDGWQRMPNEPFNARIMEHVATLSWFYAHERPWNPYYLDPHLLGRLDAALGYYLSLQHDDGSYPEYAPDEHHLSPTGFGTVAQSATLRDLSSVDALPERRVQIEAALRASSAWLVDLDKPHWELPVQYVNQVIAGLAGVAQTAAVLQDEAIAASLADRTALLLEHGQAPAGFFNEPLSSDYGYNFTVMLPDLGHIYEQTQDASVVELARRFADWFGYTVLVEPGEAEGFVVAAASARNATSTFTTTPVDDLDRSALGRILIPEVPALGAFYAPAEAKQAARAEWAASTVPVQPRAKQDSSPRLYMHVPVAPDGVTTAERDARIAQLPYLVDDDFTEAREGTLDQQFVFVRRPGYYATSMFGVRPYTRQRMGSGALWHPRTGTLVLSLNNATRDYWSTIADSGTESARADVTVTHHAGGDATGVEIPRTELQGWQGVFTSRYTTADGVITTDLSHWHDGIRRAVSTAGGAVESIPFMLGPQDEVRFSDGTVAPFNTTTTATATGLTLVRSGVALVVAWGEQADVELTTTDRSFRDDTRRHHVLTIPFTDTLTTELTTVDLAAVEGERVAFAVTGGTVRRDGKHHTAVHVVNLDTVPVDVRVVTTAGIQTFRGIAPGASEYAEFRNTKLVPAPGVAIATARGGGKPRTATRRFEI